MNKVKREKNILLVLIFIIVAIIISNMIISSNSSSLSAGALEELRASQDYNQYVQDTCDSKTTLTAMDECITDNQQ
jgi:hypothetical protein